MIYTGAYSKLPLTAVIQLPLFTRFSEKIVESYYYASLNHQYLLHFLKQHLTTFVDLVFRCSLDKRTFHFDILFNEMFIPCRVPTFRDQKVLRHCGHWGISFLFIG